MFTTYSHKSSLLNSENFSLLATNYWSAVAYFLHFEYQEAYEQLISAYSLFCRDIVANVAQA